MAIRRFSHALVNKMNVTGRMTGEGVSLAIPSSRSQLRVGMNVLTQKQPTTDYHHPKAGLYLSKVAKIVALLPGHRLVRLRFEDGCLQNWDFKDLLARVDELAPMAWLPKPALDPTPEYVHRKSLQQALDEEWEASKADEQAASEPEVPPPPSPSAPPVPAVAGPKLGEGEVDLADERDPFVEALTVGGWQQAFDPVTSRVYYWQTDTRARTWDLRALLEKETDRDEDEALVLPFPRRLSITPTTHRASGLFIKQAQQVNGTPVWHNRKSKWYLFATVGGCYVLSDSADDFKKTEARMAPFRECLCVPVNGMPVWHNRKSNWYLFATMSGCYALSDSADDFKKTEAELTASKTLLLSGTTHGGQPPTVVQSWTAGEGRVEERASVKESASEALFFLLDCFYEIHAPAHAGKVGTLVKSIEAGRISLDAVLQRLCKMYNASMKEWTGSPCKALVRHRVAMFTKKLRVSTASWNQVEVVVARAVTPAHLDKEMVKMCRRFNGVAADWVGSYPNALRYPDLSADSILARAHALRASCGAVQRKAVSPSAIVKRVLEDGERYDTVLQAICAEVGVEDYAEWTKVVPTGLVEWVVRGFFEVYDPSGSGGTVEYVAKDVSSGKYTLDEVMMHLCSRWTDKGARFEDWTGDYPSALKELTAQRRAPKKAHDAAEAAPEALRHIALHTQFKMHAFVHMHKLPLDLTRPADHLDKALRSSSTATQFTRYVNGVMEDYMDRAWLPKEQKYVWRGPNPAALVKFRLDALVERHEKDAAEAGEVKALKEALLQRVLKDGEALDKAVGILCGKLDAPATKWTGPFPAALRKVLLAQDNEQAASEGPPSTAASEESGREPSAVERVATATTAGDEAKMWKNRTFKSLRITSPPNSPVTPFGAAAGSGGGPSPFHRANSTRDAGESAFQFTASSFASFGGASEDSFGDDSTDSVPAGFKHSLVRKQPEADQYLTRFGRKLKYTSCSEDTEDGHTESVTHTEAADAVDNGFLGFEASLPASLGASRQTLGPQRPSKALNESARQAAVPEASHQLETPATSALQGTIKASPDPSSGGAPPLQAKQTQTSLPSQPSSSASLSRQHTQPGLPPSQPAANPAPSPSLPQQAHEQASAPSPPPTRAALRSNLRQGGPWYIDFGNGPAHPRAAAQEPAPPLADSVKNVRFSTPNVSRAFHAAALFRVG
eukprot:gene15583-23787_t